MQEIARLRHRTSDALFTNGRFWLRPQPVNATFYSLTIEREGMLKIKQRPRIYYSEVQKALMWDRWQKGDSLHAIAGIF